MRADERERARARAVLGAKRGTEGRKRQGGGFFACDDDGDDDDNWDEDEWNDDGGARRRRTLTSKDSAKDVRARRHVAELERKRLRLVRLRRDARARVDDYFGV